MSKKGKLFVISGPSGVGKNTIINEYIKDKNVKLSISATTRKPRDGDIDGKDYYFLTKEEFEEGIKNDNFLEYAIYNDNYYGTPKSKIEEDLNNGIDVFLELEVQGGLQIKDKFKESVLIFIMPPSIEELEERLRKRNLDSDEMIKNRLKIAEEEIQVSVKYDYMLVNQNIDSAVEKLGYIVDSEKNKN